MFFGGRRSFGCIETTSKPDCEEPRTSRLLKRYSAKPSFQFAPPPLAGDVAQQGIAPDAGSGLL